MLSHKFNSQIVGQLRIDVVWCSALKVTPVIGESWVRMVNRQSARDSKNGSLHYSQLWRI